ncbi:hypothetical protein ABW19_dt0201825 [Dactylella cylindrospora]|nr:hypothetical protein ABW19_dt0201825 [Dactylella cylindrospora]
MAPTRISSSTTSIPRPYSTAPKIPYATQGLRASCERYVATASVQVWGEDVSVTDYGFRLEDFRRSIENIQNGMAVDFYRGRGKVGALNYCFRAFVDHSTDIVVALCPSRDYDPRLKLFDIGKPQIIERLVKLLDALEQKDGPPSICNWTRNELQGEYYTASQFADFADQRDNSDPGWYMGVASNGTNWLNDPDVFLQNSTETLISDGWLAKCNRISDGMFDGIHLPNFTLPFVTEALQNGTARRFLRREADDCRQHFCGYGATKISICGPGSDDLNISIDKIITRLELLILAFKGETNYVRCNWGPSNPKGDFYNGTIALVGQDIVDTWTVKLTYDDTCYGWMADCSQTDADQGASLADIMATRDKILNGGIPRITEMLVDGPAGLLKGTICYQSFCDPSNKVIVAMCGVNNLFTLPFTPESLVKDAVVTLADAFENRDDNYITCNWLTPISPDSASQKYFGRIQSALVKEGALTPSGWEFHVLKVKDCIEAQKGGAPAPPA